MSYKKDEKLKEKERKKIPGINIIFPTGNNSVLANALLKLIKDVELRKEMGAFGRAIDHQIVFLQNSG